MASNSGVGAVLIRQGEHKGAELLSPREMIKLYVEEKNDEADLTEADLFNFVNMAKEEKIIPGYTSGVDLYLGTPAQIPKFISLKMRDACCLLRVCLVCFHGGG